MRQAIFIYLALVAALLGIVLILMLMPVDAALDPMVVVHKPAQNLPAPPPDPNQPKLGHGTLRGKVVDGRNGKPLGGALIEALMPYERKKEGEDLPLWGALRVHKRVRTGPDGTFAVSDLPPNYWNLWVEKKGYAWTTVPRAKFDETHEIKLFPACSVYGRVVYPDGRPAEGVRIEYTPQGTHSEVFGRYAAKGLESYYTTTKEDGTFLYTDLPPGKFTVEVYPSDHLPAPWLFQKPLKPGENRNLGTHKLDEGFGMEVHVKWRGTDKGVPGVEVVIRPVGDPMPRTKTGQRRRTDLNGVAKFQGLGGQVMPNPQFMVAANVDGVGPVQPDQEGLLEPGKVVTIYLRKDAIVTGKVVGPDGEPVEGFFVDLKAQGHRTRQLRTHGQAGAFKMYAVPEGRYEAHIRHKRYIDVVRPVTAVGGEEVDIGVVTLSNGAEIYGTVTRSSGEPLEGVVQVRLARKLPGKAGYQEIARAAARADGTYSIHGVPEGTWWLHPDSLRKPSSTTKPVKVVVTAGTGGIQRDLVLYGEGFLQLKFIDLVKNQERHVHAPPTTLVEESTGEKIRWFGEGTRLRSGKYTVWVELDSKRYEVTQVQVQEGQKTDPIEVRLFEVRENG